MVKDHVDPEHPEGFADWGAFNAKRSGINRATGKRWTRREINEAVRRPTPPPDRYRD